MFLSRARPKKKVGGKWSSVFWQFYQKKCSPPPSTSSSSSFFLPLWSEQKQNGCLLGISDLVYSGRCRWTRFFLPCKAFKVKSISSCQQKWDNNTDNSALNCQEVTVKPFGLITRTDSRVRWSCVSDQTCLGFFLCPVTNVQMSPL